MKGGKERQMMELMKGLLKYPHVSFELVLFSKRVDYEEVFDLNIPIHMLERKPKKDPRIFMKFYNLCKKVKPDMIHSWGSMPSIYALPAAKKLGIKLINGMIQDAPHDMKITDPRLFRAKLTFPMSDVVMGNSIAGLESYGAPAEKSFLLYNGYDLHRSQNLDTEEEVRARFNIQTPHIVGMVGAFADRKDYFTYIKAAVKVASQRKDITFLAIGGGKNLEKCEAMVPKELSPFIIFTGQQNGVESIINVFNVGVLSTNRKVHGEGISNSIMEYMAIGKPVVATDAGGTREIVRHGENGYLVDHGDADSQAKYIMELVDNPEQAVQMGQNGMKLLETEFNQEKMVQTCYELYESLYNNSENKKSMSYADITDS